MVFVGAGVYQGLKTPVEELTRLKATRPNIRQTIVKSRIAKFVAAAVIIIAVGLIALFTRRGTGGKPDTNKVTEVVKSPVELMTAISLERAFRRGGLEAVEQQSREAFRPLGLKPESLSFEQILIEFNGNSKSSERTRL